MNVQVPYEEKELVALLRQNDAAAFHHLYDRYAPAIYTIVVQIVSNKEIANDLVQKVFTVICSTIDKYEPARGTLFTWMLQIARKLSLDEVRLWNDQDPLEQGSLNRPGNLPLPAQDHDDMGLKKVMAHLGEEHKKLMELYYYRGFTIEKIARTFSVTEDSVKTGVRAALLELRNILCKK